MSKLFPPMSSRPQKGMVFAIIPCWFWVFLLFPMWMPFLGIGIWEKVEISAWLEIGYHVINGTAMALILGNYLKDEWFMVTTDARFYLGHIALTTGLMVAAELLLLFFMFFSGFNIGNMLDGLPVAEMIVVQTPLFLVKTSPIFGTISLSVFTPISICVLFYAFGFAPLCCRRPWAGYLCMAVVALIPPLVNIIWRGEAQFIMDTYFVQLPIHLLACWSYQKTDNIFTPMVSLGLTNLVASLVGIFLLG